MSEILVVDASVAVRWFVPEPKRAAAVAILESDAWLIAPEFILIEVGNALRKKVQGGEASTELAHGSLDLLREALNEVYPAARVIRRALELSLELGHPIYDCAYLALAEAKNVPLVTADDEFYAVLEGHPLQARVRVLAT